MAIYLDETSQQYESVLIDKYKVRGKSRKSIFSRFRLLFLAQRGSIAALFACINRSDLKNLEHLYIVGELQSLLEELFTSLLASDDPQVTVHIKNIVWELSDYRRCSLYFNTLTNCEFLQLIILLLLLSLLSRSATYSHTLPTLKSRVDPTCVLMCLKQFVQLKC